MYGKQLDAPLEEVTEMIAILKAIQKGQRELYLLTQRARVMCPNLLDASVNDDIYRLMNYSISAAWSYDTTPTKIIDELQQRKQELLDPERIDTL